MQLMINEEIADPAGLSGKIITKNEFSIATFIKPGLADVFAGRKRSVSCI